MKKLSWKDIEKVTDELTEKIKSSNFMPDCLMGITTGGLIPLYFLAKKLKVNNILTISTELNEKKELTIKYSPEVNLKSKKILLIDEITETGNSLKKVLDFVNNKYDPKEVKTATLGMNKDKSQFCPDFYVLVEQGEWIVFPWEKEESWVKEEMEYPNK